MALDNQSARLIAALKFDPGYLLLCDYLQAHLDTITDELADRDLADTAAPAKLRYWQAFRDILHTLKVQPAQYAQVLTEDRPSAEEEHLLTGNDWARLQKQALEASFISQLSPEEDHPTL